MQKIFAEKAARNLKALSGTVTYMHISRKNSYEFFF